MKKASKNRLLKKVLTTSAAETKKFGVLLGKALKAGDVLAVSGDLGAGKTTLIRGIVKGLCSKDDVSSPTFTLIHEYAGREKIYHMDWYRLKKVAGTDRQLAEECLADDAVTIIEWPERGIDLLPRSAIRIRIEHGGAASRTLSWKGISV